MTDEERDKMVAKVHRTFAFRVFRCLAFLMAALVIVTWTVPDLQGPALTLVLVGVPVLTWVVDTMVERL